MLHAHVACLMSLTQNNQKQQNFKIHFVFLLSYVTFHYRQQPQPQALPLLTPPLCTVVLFAKTKSPPKKSRILETLTLSTYADNSIVSKNFKIMLGQLGTTHRF